MVQAFHKFGITGKIAVVLIMSFIAELIAPARLYALSGGPSQPEYEKFQPVSSNDMVDLFTGDLKYNIPLFEIGGYPVNLVYDANVGVEEEASWVGLGWNINVGSINRMVRGVPDDFKGDQIKQEEYRKPKEVYTAFFQRNREKPAGEVKFDFDDYNKRAASPIELLAYSLREKNPSGEVFNRNNTYSYNVLKSSWGIGVEFDSYRGIALKGRFNRSLNEVNTRWTGRYLDVKSANLFNTNPEHTYGLLKSSLSSTNIFNFSMDYSSNEGTSLHGSVNLLASKKKANSLLGVPSFEVNSINGLSNLGILTGFNPSFKNMSLGINALLQFRPTPPLSFSPNYMSYSVNLDYEHSRPKALWDKRKYRVYGTYTKTYLAENVLSRESYGYMYHNHSANAASQAEHVVDFQREAKDFDEISPLLATSQWTPDIFSVTGHGAGNAFQASHNRVYLGRVPDRRSTSIAVSAQGEFGKLLNNTEFGISLGGNLNKEESTSWSPELYAKFRETFGEGQVSRNALAGKILEGYRVQLNKLGENSGRDYVMHSIGDIGGSWAKVSTGLHDVSYIQPVLKREKFSLHISAESFLKDDRDQNKALTNQSLVKDKRNVQSETMQILTQSEAAKYGYNPDISYIAEVAQSDIRDGVPCFNPSFNSSNVINTIAHPRVQNLSHAKDHHVGEIVINKEGGGRYVYGLPVYSFYQKDYSFNIGKPKTEYGEQVDHWAGIASGLVQNIYDPSKFNDKHNNRGVDGALSIKEMPAHVTNLLLTQVLSGDYVDNDGVAGPSDNDVGDWVVFRYSKSGTYSWRAPYHDRSAYLDKNVLFDPEDDRGVFSEGQREQYHLGYMESKTSIAIFFTEFRADAISAKGESSRLLRRIEIYNKAEFKKSGAGAVPVKVIHFDYSYDLCPEVRNFESQFPTLNRPHPLSGIGNAYNGQTYVHTSGANKGKLTLQKVWFSYGKIQWNTTGSYMFEYDLNNNPDYSERSVDMWGTYMDNKQYRNPLLSDNDYRQINIQEYPYTVQDEIQANRYAGAYKLKRIHMPTGSTVTIDYEADDYAYVQNERAMKNYQVAGFGTGENLNSATFTSVDKSKLHNVKNLFQAPPGNGVQTMQPWIFVKVDNDITTDALINKDDLLRISSAVAFTEKPNPGRYHDINAYMEVGETGIKTINGQRYLCIRILPYRYKLIDVHPLTKFGWQFLRDQLPYLLRPTKERKVTIENVNLLGTLTGFLHDFQKMVAGEALFMLQNGYCNSVDLNRTFVRLNVAGSNIDRKFGGGYRVKSVTLSDNWGSVAAPETSKSYVTNYSYTAIENNRTISSGVATMEPGMSDESPLVRPVSLPSPKTMNEIKRQLVEKIAGDFMNALKNNGIKPSNTGFLRSNTLSYDEGPVGEWFYPNPSIGYSKVTVTNALPNTEIKRNAGVKLVAEYYTAKDYPVIVKVEPIKTEHLRFNVKNPFQAFSGASLKDNSQFLESTYTISPNLSYRKDIFGASQGFKIELNDMHGKPKAQYTYPLYGDQYTTAQFYRYHETINADKVRCLSNLVTVINKDGSHENKELGVEVEVAIDSEKIKSAKTEIGANVDYDHIEPLVPAVALSLNMHYRKRESYKATITKVVRRQGILVETEVVDKESRIITKNIAFDGDNGSVLLSATQNEFKDWIYTLTKPARWIYTGLDGSWKNVDFYLSLDVNPDGTADDHAFILTNGDELVDVITGEKFWVIHHEAVSVSGVSVNKVLIVDKSGNTISAVGNMTRNFRLIRSGYRDLVNAPAEEVTLIRNPLELDNVYKAQSSTVIGAKAFEYYDRSQLYSNKPKCIYIKCSTSETGNQSMEFSDDDVSGFVGFCFIDNQGIANLQNGQIVNPYYVGIKGRWRAFKELVYYDKGNMTHQRDQDEEVFGNPNTTNIRYSGTLKEFIPYWNYSNGIWISQNNHQWKETENLTYSDNSGNNLESYSPLNIFSAVLYGHKKQLPIAVAGNALYKDILFDGFEDYTAYGQGLFICANGQPVIHPDAQPVSTELNSIFRHWPLWQALVRGNAVVSNEYSHSGWNSVQLKPGTASIKLDQKDLSVSLFDPWQSYRLNNTDFIPYFDPRPLSGSRKFLVSFWYKSGVPVAFDMPGCSLVATSENGKKVDQWIKAEYEVTLTASLGSGSLTLQFINSHGIENAYFDDFRMLPKEAKMSCYVYDNKNNRLMATLDDNHYATFYEYDEDGSLVRTKVETERGIMTVSQNRSNIRK